MPFDKLGTIVINTTVAGGALPLSDTVIKIVGGAEENRNVEYSIISDIDGVSEKISVPAPSRTLSLSPGASTPAYAVYNIVASAPGYYTKRIYNVVVFEGEETILPINMIPMSIHEGISTYPRDNLNTFVEENPLL